MIIYVGKDKQIYLIYKNIVYICLDQSNKP